jgi:hypothetical protein
MDTQRRQKPRGWLERQGAGLCESAGYELETSPARGRKPSRLFLRKNDWDEEEVDERKNSKRSKLTDQQKPAGVELLIWK